MGVENNNAVIATTWQKEEITVVREWVATLEPFWKGLFLFSGEKINGKVTVIMVPEGSKEGYEESDYGDKLRYEFIALLEKAEYEDKSSPWAWVEVGFGEFGQKVLRGNCTNKYSDEDYASLSEV